MRRILALGDLLPRIRALYGRRALDVASIRHLTLASKAQQRAWLALLDDQRAHAPTGAQLKTWLFGNASISTKVALFRLKDYQGRIIADLFGDEAYFEDEDAFWTLQNEAIARLRDKRLDKGWISVEVLAPGEPCHAWDYEKTTKAKGGRVFIAVIARGEVTVHDGDLPLKEARRAAFKSDGGGGGAVRVERSDFGSGLQTYIDLHRHAAARAALTDHPSVALRLLIAHAIAGSCLWRVEPEPPLTRDGQIAARIAASTAEQSFEDRRRKVFELLHLPPNGGSLVANTSDEAKTVTVFAQLLGLPDVDVVVVAAIVMGETMKAGNAVVEAVGRYLHTPMGELWAPDQIFFDQIRDRQVTNALLAEVGGQRVADGDVTDKVKSKRSFFPTFQPVM